MKLRVVSIILALQSAMTTVSAQVDCSLLDPRASISSEKEGKIQGALDTLYKIARADVAIEGKLKSEIKNLQQGTASISEKYAISARMIYLFCGMVANAKDIGTERKSQLLNELEARIREQSSQSTHTPKTAEGKQNLARTRGQAGKNPSEDATTSSTSQLRSDSRRKLPDQPRDNAAGNAPERTTGSKNPAQVIQAPLVDSFSLKFLDFTATADAWLTSWASPSGKLIAYCTEYCRSIVVKATKDMREIARINTRAPNIDGDQNSSWYALGFSHDDGKLVVSYVAGIDNYRSKPSKAVLFNLLRGGEQEWEIEIPLGGIDVFNVGSTFSPDDRHVLIGNLTMAESATGNIVGRFESGGKGWCGLADGSLASYHARTIKWVDSRPVSGLAQYDYLSCGKKIAIVGTATRVGDRWKRTAYIANGIDRSSWKKIPGDSWNSGERISPDLRFSVKYSGEIIVVASGGVVGTMSNALRTSCETQSNWKPHPSNVYWQANGEFLVWESSDLCGRGPGFARFAIN